MIPQTQSRTGSNGRCFNACLASILEIHESEVPDFDKKTWLEEVARFLEPHGLYYVQVEIDDPILPKMFSVGRVYHTIEGISYRGGPHAVVGLNGETVWDPHPLDGSRHGLKTIECFGLLCARCSD